MNLQSKKIKSFQKKILLFYQENGRDLPWRKTTNPYYILLSEVMLQQTQVDRVKEYYKKWVKTWPTINDLAKAKRSDVLHMWLGLGYNTRAVNVHKTAQKVVKNYDGKLVNALPHYKELPGIGPYTVRAVNIFAFNNDEVTVDTNIRRIFIYEFKLSEKISDKELWKIAEKCLPKGKSREWHNALMDYGATFLTSRRTGIKPKTQQSKFEGSDRQLRAQMLRFLLKKNKPVLFSALIKFVKENDETRIKRILNGMKKDDLIEEKNKKYVLKEAR